MLRTMRELTGSRRPSSSSVATVHPVAPIPVRVAGLATAAGEHWTESAALADVLLRVWPHLDGRVAQLLGDSPAQGRHLSRPVEELMTPLPLTRQGPLYTDIALRLATRAAREALDQAHCEAAEIGAVIVVSCTGFVLPGLDSRLIPRLGLRPDVVRTPLTQLGCAGGVAGLAHGVEWVRGGQGRRALVVAVELPSLTFRPGDRSRDNLLSALVFSDGAGAVVLDAPASNSSAHETVAGLHFGRAASRIVADTAGALGYELVDDGFKVVLSRVLPALIEARLGEVVGGFLGGRDIGSLDVIAAHPGGTAILDAVERSLGARADQLAASRATFSRVGNSSAAAIFFVLDELARANPRPGSCGIALGFGPGLAIEILEMTWLG